MKRMISLFFMCIISLFLPQVAQNGAAVPRLFQRELVSAVAPVFSYQEEVLEKHILLASEAEYENRRAAEQYAGVDVDTENPAEQPDDSADSTEMAEPADSAADDTCVTENSYLAAAAGETGAQDASDGENGQEAAETATEAAQAAESGDSSGQLLLEKLKDFDYLVQNYYTVDSSTTIQGSDLDVDEFLGKDLAVNRAADGPQILIYHTHSQEEYLSSGDGGNTVVAVGEYLAQILTEQYGYRVLHHTGEYDVDDRDHAYSNAAPALQALLEENPTIEVVIDLHRDSVPEENHLVTDINGKQTAKIMFFNGMSRTTASGELERLANPYREDNLAFSLQMQLAAAQKYPGLTRKIYIKGYRYNMHFCPKTLLVEVGAQNNTVEEAKNAMEPLAELLAEVLQ